MTIMYTQMAGIGYSIEVAVSVTTLNIFKKMISGTSVTHGSRIDRPDQS